MARSTSWACVPLVKENCSTFLPAYSVSFSGKRGALPAPCRQPAPHLLPKKRRQVEADQVVERAARLLRIDEVERQVARLGHRLTDGVARDLVEDHPMDRLAVELAARVEDLLQVPGDRLALA